jgi:hypothetical protein
MICIAKYKDQLMALGTIPGAPGSEAKAFTDLKADQKWRRLPESQLILKPTYFTKQSEI